MKRGTKEEKRIRSWTKKKGGARYLIFKNYNLETTYFLKRSRGF